MSATRLWIVFKQSLLSDTNQQPIYLGTRHHYGSYFAFGMSIYNLYLLRQKILKNSIYLLKSNNHYLVKAMSIFVGTFYFLGLYTIWHIPSLGAEIATRVYCASQNAITDYLTIKAKKAIFSIQNIDKILENQGLKI